MEALVDSSSDGNEKLVGLGTPRNKNRHHPKTSFSCSDQKFAAPCQFKIWKSYHSATISFTDVKALLSRNATKTKNCKSKDGEIYKAKFRLKSDGTLEYLLVRSSSKNKG